MDKTVLSVVALSDEMDEGEKTYWFSKIPQERLQVLELTRQIICQRGALGNEEHPGGGDLSLSNGKRSTPAGTTGSVG